MRRLRAAANYLAASTASRRPARLFRAECRINIRNKRQAASANALGNVIQHSSGPVLRKKARAAPAREQL
jgi:hypothetical protein